MKKQEFYNLVIERFEDEMPIAETELHYDSPFGLLVAVILSAQCTDKRVNQVTPALLEAYPDAAHMAQASAEDIFPYIRSVSYPNNKASHLASMARMLTEDFNGTVPGNMDDLIKLPGVGRKTANVMLSVAFHQSAMAVDTHVFRVSHRIGLVPQSCTTPLSVEKELVRYIPSQVVPKAHHWLILHGRYVCLSRNPRCSGCFLDDICKKRNLKAKASRIPESARKQTHLSQK